MLSFFLIDLKLFICYFKMYFCSVFHPLCFVFSHSPLSPEAHLADKLRAILMHSFSSAIK